MKHHFVPQFYLKGFTDPTTPVQQTPYLWVADINAQTIKKRAPENAAALTDYYAVQDEAGATVQDIETILSGIESDASQVIAVIAGGRYDLMGLQETFRGERRARPASECTRREDQP